MLRQKFEDIAPHELRISLAGDAEDIGDATGIKLDGEV